MQRTGRSAATTPINMNFEAVRQSLASAQAQVVRFSLHLDRSTAKYPDRPCAHPSMCTMSQVNWEAHIYIDREHVFPTIGSWKTTRSSGDAACIPRWNKGGGFNSTRQYCRSDCVFRHLSCRLLTHRFETDPPSLPLPPHRLGCSHQGGASSFSIGWSWLHSGEAADDRAHTIVVGVYNPGHPSQAGKEEESCDVTVVTVCN